MAGYRCYFLDAEGHIKAREEFKADTNEHALALARSLYAEQGQKFGFELWLCGGFARKVHKESPKSATRPPHLIAK